MTLLLSIALFFLACDNTNTPTEKSKETPKVSTPPTETNTGPVVLPDAYLPSITLDELTNMWQVCNQIDYLFYDLPISSSVNDIQSAQAHLRHISDTPVSMKEKERCKKSIGRIFFKSDGEDLIEADAFFGGGCAFFVFYKGGKAVYSNLMTPDGVNHFNQIISAATGKTNIGQ